MKKLLLALMVLLSFTNNLRATSANTIIVKKVSGAKIDIKINLNSTLGEVREKIKEKEDIPLFKQKLLREYNGKNIELNGDDKTLSDLNIKDGDELHFVEKEGEIVTVATPQAIYREVVKQEGWAAALRKQCKAADGRFFLKQKNGDPREVLDNEDLKKLKDADGGKELYLYVLTKGLLSKSDESQKSYVYVLVGLSIGAIAGCLLTYISLSKKSEKKKRAQPEKEGVDSGAASQVNAPIS